MNQNAFIVSLALLTLAVLANRGNGSRAHFAVQLYLLALVLLAAVVGFRLF